MLQIGTTRQDSALPVAARLLTVVEAVTLFMPAPPPIRRDFDELSEKEHRPPDSRGIKPYKSVDNGILPFSLRELQYSAEKEALTREAVKLLQPGNVVFIDGGTTTFHLGLCLPDMDLR
jgi:DeoR/GlpR family transcriptional regulator of sugar metabolism